MIEESEIIVQGGDEPRAVVDLTDTDELAGEDGTQVDLAPSDADAAAVGGPYSSVVERVVGLELHRELVWANPARWCARILGPRRLTLLRQHEEDSAGATLRKRCSEQTSGLQVLFSNTGPCRCRS